MPGLLSLFSDPEQMGLLGLSSGLLQAGGPSRLPVSLGSALGLGLQQGAQAAQATQQFNDTTKLKGLQSKSIELANAGAERRQKALDDFANALPPDQRGLFLANPAAYIKSLTEGYTLSPGQVRVQGGKEVARVAPNLDFRSVGDALVGLRPDTGEVATTPIKLGVSPDARARIDFDRFQFSNLSANQLANLATDRAKLGLQAADTYFNTGLKPIPGLLPGLPQIASSGGVQPTRLGVSPAPAAIPPSVDSATPKQRAQLAVQQPQATSALQSVTMNIDNALKNVDDLLKSPGLSNITGPVMGRTPNVTGDATNAQAYLDTLKSQIGVQTLQAMREASKTGGAVGNVTEKEWPILQNQLGALQQSQTTEQFVKNLKQVKETLARIKANATKAYESVYGTVPSQGPQSGWSIEPLP